MVWQSDDGSSKILLVAASVAYDGLAFVAPMAQSGRKPCTGKAVSCRVPAQTKAPSDLQTVESDGGLCNVLLDTDAGHVDRGWNQRTEDGTACGLGVGLLDADYNLAGFAPTTGGAVVLPAADGDSAAGRHLDTDDTSCSPPVLEAHCG